MDEILDEELSNLLKKHNIPLELVCILADDASRMLLDDGDTLSSGITFCSNDDGKKFAISECIRKIKESNPQYMRALSKRKIINFTDDKETALKERKPEHVIDLDNIDIEEEIKKAIFRYTNSFLVNKLEIDDLNTQVNGISKEYSRLHQANVKLSIIKNKLENFKLEVAKIENSRIPKIFRRKRLKENRQKVISHMKQLEIAREICERENEACDKLDELITPRKKRIHVITSYNGIIGQRVGDLLNKYGLSPEIIKSHLPKSIDIKELLESSSKKKETELIEFRNKCRKFA